MDAAISRVGMAYQPPNSANGMDQGLDPLQIIPYAFQAADEIRQMAMSDVDNNPSASEDNNGGSSWHNMTQS